MSVGWSAWAQTEAEIEALGTSSWAPVEPTTDKSRVYVDFYGAHSNVTTYPGYQDDMSATVYWKYSDYKLTPFIRAMTSGLLRLTVQPISGYQWAPDLIICLTTYSDSGRWSNRFAMT